MSENDNELIEMKTFGQSRNKNWFLSRASSRTVSKLKDVSYTYVSKRSLHLLQATYYPTTSILKSAATESGIAHEQAALTKYKPNSSQTITILWLCTIYEMLPEDQFSIQFRFQ